MVTDINLIREILLNLRKKIHAGPSQMLIKGYSKDVINYHCQELANEGFMTVAILSTGTVLPRSLTDSGREFSDAIVDYKIWDKAILLISKVDHTTSLDLIKRLVTKVSEDSELSSNN